MPPIEVPEDLVKRITAGDVVLFLGSQIVACTDDGEPTYRWEELVWLLAERSGYPEDDRSLARVAQHYERIKGRQALHDFLIERLADPRFVPCPTHHLIAQLPFRVIFSTAMDLLLDQALLQAGHRLQKVTTRADIADFDPDSTLVIKLLGDVERGDTIVITEDDHLRYIDQSPLRSDVVRARLATSIPLFLHSDLDDPYLRQVYDQVIRQQGQHKARGFAVHPGPSDHQVRFWAQRNLSIIVADPVAFLQTLQREISKDHQ